MMFNAQSNKINMYCLVYGQMSHWGFLISASYGLIILIISKIVEKYKIINTMKTLYELNNLTGLINIDILSILYGSLLGDCYGKKSNSRN